LLNAVKLPVRIMTGILLALFGVLSFSRMLAWRSAVHLYEDILRKYPDNFVALNSAGVENMMRNNDSKALEYLDRAVDVAPSNYKGYYNRGLLYLKNSRPREALESFNECLALYEYSKAYVGRASAYYMVNDLPKAINDASYALELDKKNSKAYFVLGNC